MLSTALTSIYFQQKGSSARYTDLPRFEGTQQVAKANRRKY